ncbi:MAG: ATP-binding response regulator [Anaerolineae bacterium]
MERAQSWQQVSPQETREPSAFALRAEIVDLSHATLRILSAASMAGGWLWLFLAATLAGDPTRSADQARTLLPPLLLIVSSTIGLLGRRSGLVARCAVLLAGMAFSLLLGHAWMGGIHWLYLLSLVALVAGLLLGPAAALAGVAALSAGLLAPWAGLGKAGLLTMAGPVALLWLAALVSWLASHSLYTALRWALDSQQRATDLLIELRRRQGELNRTLDALTEASRRLERSNQELAIARERADEARALKESFVANVSHELRTPLNLIVGFSEIMFLQPESYEGVGWTAELQGDIGQVYRASQHLQSLVNDILDLSRIDAARLPMLRELADLRTVIDDAVETIAPLLRQRGLGYAIECPDPIPLLFIDRTRMRQVMLNLLNNAMRFTDSGTITVAIREEHQAVLVSVSDTGVGIPADHLDTIFEEFQQVDAGPRRRGGAGLGLSLSRQFVDLHGGRMWAESVVGVGSTFHFTIPLPGAVPQTTPLLVTPDPKGLRKPFGSAPVIVVDPDPGIATMLSRYLADRPVLSAKDVPEAEALVEAEHPSAIVINEPPDAPAERWVGPAGDISRRYGVPVLRCSMPSPSWLKRAPGLDDCLNKPVSRGMLRSAFGRLGVEPGTTLIIDDHPGFGSLMRRMLRTESLARNVLIAHTGMDGLRLARQARPAVVLLDLLLPDVDGFAVLEALRADPECAGMRIVAVTATSYAEEALRRRGGCFTVSQARGISTGTYVELFNQVLEVLKPEYE